jgi:hypothetical protein
VAARRRPHPGPGGVAARGRTGANPVPAGHRGTPRALAARHREGPKPGRVELGRPRGHVAAGSYVHAAVARDQCGGGQGDGHENKCRDSGAPPAVRAVDFGRWLDRPEIPGLPAPGWRGRSSRGPPLPPRSPPPRRSPTRRDRQRWRRPATPHSPRRPTAERALRQPAARLRTQRSPTGRRRRHPRGPTGFPPGPQPTRRPPARLKGAQRPNPAPPGPPTAWPGRRG